MIAINATSGSAEASRRFQLAGTPQNEGRTTSPHASADTEGMQDPHLLTEGSAPPSAGPFAAPGHRRDGGAAPNSMTFEYDPNLVEQAVFLAVRGDASLNRRLHRITNPLYSLPAGRERDERFREACLVFFGKLGLDGLIVASIAERPVIGRRVGRCVVREAPGSRDESADLFVDAACGTGFQPVSAGAGLQSVAAGAGPTLGVHPKTPSPCPLPHGGRGVPAPTLIIQLTPTTLLDSSRALPLLRRELLHVADMLDDGFGYRREAIDGLPPQQNLVRDRYRVLWDIFVEGRLTREGRGEEACATRLRTAFARTFRDRGRPADVRAFDALFNAASLTHRQLLQWASSPDMMPDELPVSSVSPVSSASPVSAPSAALVPALSSAGRMDGLPGSSPLVSPPARAGTGAQAGAEPGGRPGEPCPLCGFPTFDWMDFASAELAGLAAAVRAFRLDWSPAAGACRQCAETYAAMAAARSMTD